MNRTSPLGARERILVAEGPSPIFQIMSSFGFAGGVGFAVAAASALAGGAGGAGLPCNDAKPIKLIATNNVAASAPHFVLRFQKSAATITGAIAAKPENA